MKSNYAMPVQDSVRHLCAMSPRLLMMIIMMMNYALHVNVLLILVKIINSNNELQTNNTNML